MSDPLPFELRRFRTAAAHYLAGRPPYPAELIRRVAESCTLRATDRVMDLGCGPGQLARAFAPLVQHVVGIDPEPEMLRVAAAQSSNVANITWRRASSHDLSPDLGRFRLVCMGRSFHWMDRAETLRRLDTIIEPDGAVVLFRDDHPQVSENAWYAIYRAVLARYSADDPSRTGGRMQHRDVLLESAFSNLESISVSEKVTVTADMLIDRALSLSSTSRARLGGRADSMVGDLRAVLPFGMPLHEVVESTALVARRPV